MKIKWEITLNDFYLKKDKRKSITYFIDLKTAQLNAERLYLDPCNMYTSTMKLYRVEYMSDSCVIRIF